MVEKYMKSQRITKQKTYRKKIEKMAKWKPNKKEEKQNTLGKSIAPPPQKKLLQKL